MNHCHRVSYPRSMLSGHTHERAQPFGIWQRRIGHTLARVRTTRCDRPWPQTSTAPRLLGTGLDPVAASPCQGRADKPVAIDSKAVLCQVQHGQAGQKGHGLRGDEERMARNSAPDGIRDPWEGGASERPS